ncbi:amidohydrolase family enzyme [Sphingopyxis sp. C-1]|nr:amidohydrolase family enzyme [Sphingopyxis sp. C-1]
MMKMPFRQSTQSQGMALPRRKLMAACLMLTLVAGCGAHGTPANPLPSPKPGPLRIDHVTVVDPLDGALQEDMTIRIEDGKIVAISKTGRDPARTGETILDGRGKFAVPGFNNMHSHALIAKYPRLMLATMLAEGTTGFRQMSASDDLLRDRRENRLPIGNDTPALLQMPGELLTPLNAFAPGPARATIKAQHEEGADFIKIIMMPRPAFFAAVEEAHRLGLRTAGHIPSSVSMSEAIAAGYDSIEHFGTGNAIWVACARPGTPAPPTSSAGPLAALTRGPGYLLNPAAAESEEAVQQRQLLLNAFDEDTCRKSAHTMLAKPVWQVPTLVRLRTQELADAPEYQSDPALANMTDEAIAAWRASVERFKALPSASRDTFRQSYALRLRIVSLWNAEGVSMMTGTDGKLEVPGQSLQQEFGELAKAGLSPLRILQMTTTDPARYLGRKDMGRIVPGAPADVVLLDANPLVAATNLGKIAFVVRNGKSWSKDHLARNVEEQRSAKQAVSGCSFTAGDRCGN